MEKRKFVIKVVQRPLYYQHPDTEYDMFVPSNRVITLFDSYQCAVDALATAEALLEEKQGMKQISKDAELRIVEVPELPTFLPEKLSGRME